MEFIPRRNSILGGDKMKPNFKRYTDPKGKGLFAKFIGFDFFSQSDRSVGKLVLLGDTASKISKWCKGTQSECGGMGLVRKYGPDFLVYEVFLPDQVCSVAHTEITEKGKYDMIRQCHMRGLKGSDRKFWWHTHFDFAPFWSGTDNSTARELCKNSSGWGVSLVVNQSEQYEARLDKANSGKHYGALDVELLKFREYPNKSATKDIKRNVKVNRFGTMTLSELKDLKKFKDSAWGPFCTQEDRLLWSD